MTMPIPSGADADLRSAIETLVIETDRHAAHLRSRLLALVARLDAREQARRDPRAFVPPMTLDTATEDSPLCDVCLRPRVLCLGCHDEPPSTPLPDVL